MRRLHAVISGSTALSFISRDPWEAGDIDLYCPLGTADVICKYLCAAEGYDEAETVWDSPYSQVQGIEKVFKVRKFDPRHGTRSIDVIESINTMAVHPITHFHITAVMNYLFADGIVVLYPELTFKRIAVKSAKPNTRHPPYSKYKDRNYTICNMGRDGLICRTACELLQRTPQDAASLALRFRSSDTPMPTLGYWTLSQDRPLPESITPLEAPECYNYLCNKRKFIPVRP
ncbi:hypothetical protein SISSUDRAFT_992710 [Sistotremastrum suecicum HHB10207 ss-3]|nr:hypothetical protein SISSUDRAFT_992710 [Sistotremastrum suecicum HHB10207 ss-3]